MYLIIWINHIGLGQRVSLPLGRWGWMPVVNRSRIPNRKVSRQTRRVTIKPRSPYYLDKRPLNTVVISSGLFFLYGCPRVSSKSCLLTGPRLRLISGVMVSDPLPDWRRPSWNLYVLRKVTNPGQLIKCKGTLSCQYFAIEEVPSK